MKITGRDLLATFCRKHTDARRWIANWLADIETAVWATPADIRRRYRTASFLHDNCVVFNVKGNRYRLEVEIAYRAAVVNVKWIGTHAEYDHRLRRH